MVFDIVSISLLMMLASGFSSVTGFGTSTLSIPILLFFFSLPQTLFFVGVMRLIAAVWKMILFRGRFRWNLILTVGIPAVFASVLGARTLLLYTDYISKKALGGFLLFYVGFILLRPHFRLPEKSSVAVSGGVLAGFSAGVFGISGPIQSAFLSAFDLQKITYIFTTATLDCIIDTSRITTYFLGGIQLGDVLLYSIIFSTPAIFLGAWLARKIVHWIPQSYFRMVVTIFLGVVGLRWLIWG